jgi:hypothetical protein
MGYWRQDKQPKIRRKIDITLKLLGNSDAI